MNKEPIINPMFISIISNAGKTQQLIQLLEFRNLIGSQLFNMSKIYATKTIFHKIHKTMLLKNEEKQIVGGICFYQIQKYDCVNIIFFAVDGKFQVKGYGSYLMNCFKQQMRKKGFKTLTTHADATSLNFYYKNGFIQFQTKGKRKMQNQPIESQLKQIEQEQDYNKKYKKYQPWLEYIENYYSSVLLVYRIYPHLDFTNFKSIISLQKRGLVQILNTKSYRNYSFKKDEMIKLMQDHRTKYQVKYCKVLCNQNAEKIQQELQAQQKQLILKQIQVSKLQQIALLKLIKSHECSWILRMDFIKIPQTFHQLLPKLYTLQWIQQKIVNNSYTSSEEMCAQLYKLFQNLKLFLPYGSNYYQACQHLEIFLKPNMISICEGTFNAIEYLRKQTSKQDKKLS